jgi:hypothetical protein
MKKNRVLFKKSRILVLSSFIVSAFVLLFIVTGRTEIQMFESGFESESEVKEKFRFDKIEDHAWQITADEKHFGRKGLKITVNKGDKLAKNAERSEIQDPLKISLDDEAWYRIDFKIPKDFPEIDNRLMIWQLKQSGDDNPLIAMNYEDGKLKLKQTFNLIKINYYQPKEDFKDRWIRIVVHAKASHAESGFINVYLDNTQIIQYKGQTAHHNKWEQKTYFKFGLYRDVIDVPMHMYYDQYIRGSSWNEVVPETSNPKVTKKLWRLKIKKKKK